MKKKEHSFFWASYSDLMTSLFFVMFVLFISIFVLFENRINELRKGGDSITILKDSINLLNTKIDVTEKQVKALKEIQKPSKYIDKKLFEYDEKYKRYSLKEGLDIKFELNSDVIRDEDKPKSEAIGRSIVNLIKNAQYDPEYTNLNTRFLVIIEGMASIDNSSNEKYNFELSYRRALSLFYDWKQYNDIKHVLTDEDICEVILSGSGWYGVGRDVIDEKNNQRFWIQIIPKINTNE